MGLKSENINYCQENDALHKLFKTSQYPYIDKLTSLKLFHIFLNLFTLLRVSSLSLWHHFVEKHYYISISSSPELWATEKLYRGECVSAGGLEVLRGLGDGHGVGVCRHTVCCLRCFCNESLSLWLKGSSGGRHSTSSIQERLLKCEKDEGDTNISIPKGVQLRRLLNQETLASWKQYLESVSHHYSYFCFFPYVVNLPVQSISCFLYS